MSRRSARNEGMNEEPEEGFPKTCPNRYCKKLCKNKRAYDHHINTSKACARALLHFAKTERGSIRSERESTGSQHRVTFAQPLEDYSAPMERDDISDDEECNLATMEWEDSSDEEEDEEEEESSQAKELPNIPTTNYQLKEACRLFFEKPDGFDSSYLGSAFGQKGQQNYHEDMFRNMDAERKSDLELLEITKGHSSTLFKKIRQWRYNSENDYNHRMDHDSYTKKERAKIIQDIERDYCLQKCRPMTRRFLLPNIKSQADLTVNSFLQDLLRLLSDPELMKESNLLIDPKNPFQKPKLGGNDGFLGEINTGSVFVDAYNRMCTHEKDLLVPILLGMDKSHCDVKGKLTLEPLMWTLGIFNLETRRKPQAWCRLGHMPNLDHLAPRANAVKKLKDYHFILRVMMEELIQFQKLGGIEWTLCLDGKEVDVRLQIPVMFCIGDTEGHDKLVGRKVDRNTMTNKQCRCCDVSHVDCDNPGASVTLTKASAISKLRQEKNFHELDSLSYRLIQCAFDDVIFADQERGIHGATPAETLHAVGAGTMDRVLESSYEMKREKKKTTDKKSTSGKKRKSNDAVASARKGKRSRGGERGGGRSEDGDDGGERDKDGDIQQTYEAPEDQELGPRYIFGPSQRDLLDNLSRKVHKYLRWQSERSLPRTNFPQGICSLVKMTHNERTGVLLVLLLILCMDNMECYYRKHKTNRSQNVRIPPHSAGYLVNEIGDTHFSSMAKYISLVLMMESYLKMDRVPIDCIPYTSRFLKSIMSGLFSAFPRRTGTGYATIKTHLVTHHMIQDQLRFGSLDNVSSESLESGHKYHIKSPGKRTQKRAASFSAQVGMQAHYSSVVERAFKDHPHFKPKEEESAPADGVSPAWISISADAVFNGAPTSTRGDDITKDIPHLLDEVITKNEMLDLVRNRILPFVQGDMVSIHVTFVQKGIRYQANPCFGSEQVGRQHWALVDRTKTVGRRRITDQVGMHLLFIVRVPDLVGDPIQFDTGTSISGAGDYLITHTLAGPLRETGPGDAFEWKFGTLAEQNQRLVHARLKVRNKDHTNAVCAVPVELVSGPLVGLPHPGAEHTKAANHEYFYFIVGQDRWADMFIECAKKEIALTKEDEKEWNSFLRKYNVMEGEDDDGSESSEDSGITCISSNRRIPTSNARRNRTLQSENRRSSTPSGNTCHSRTNAISSVARTVQRTPNSTRTEDSGITTASRRTTRRSLGSNTPDSNCTENTMITVASRNTQSGSRMNASTPNSTNTENTMITVASRNTRTSSTTRASRASSTAAAANRRNNNDNLCASDDTSSGVSSEGEDGR